MRITIVLIGVALLGAFQGCSDNNKKSAQSSAPEVMEEVDNAHSDNSAELFDLLDKYTKTLLQQNPLMATSLGVSEELVGMKFNDKIGSFDVSRIEEAKALRLSMSNDIQKIDRTKLTGTAATTYDVVSSSLAMTEEFEPYVFGSFNPLYVFTPYSVTQLLGSHIELARALQTEHPLKNKDDVEDYLTRLGLIGGALAGLGDIFLYDANQGVTPPQFSINGSLNVIKQMTSPKASESPLVISLTSRLEKVESITATERAEYAKRAAKIVMDKVYPGYQKLESALNKVLPTAQTEAGIWALKDGDKRYQLALRNFGAGDKTPEQVHQLGLSEVKRVQAEMDVILTSLGNTEGDVMTRVIELSEDPSFLYPNTDEGRQTLLDDLNKQMQEIDLLLPNILTLLPKAGVEVRRIPEYEQDNAPGGYYTTPSLDGSRPGIYWINLKSTADWPSYTLPTLTYHEASPGHHLQSTIAQEIEDMPMFRKMMWFSAFGEGWALYAELLAKELGLYENDPHGDLGRLQSELFRSARLVVDTGIHYKKWTREQAIDWMHKQTGESVAAVTREIERYAVLPGQATSYKMGQIRILELRALATEKLAEKFDLREFNDQLLINGAVQLPVLATNIEKWIETKLMQQ